MDIFIPKQQQTEAQLTQYTITITGVYNVTEFFRKSVIVIKTVQREIMVW